jgi:hypothetical protein
LLPTPVALITRKGHYVGGLDRGGKSAGREGMDIGKGTDGTALPGPKDRLGSPSLCPKDRQRGLGSFQMTMTPKTQTNKAMAMFLPLQQAPELIQGIAASPQSNQPTDPSPMVNLQISTVVVPCPLWPVMPHLLLGRLLLRPEAPLPPPTPSPPPWSTYPPMITPVEAFEDKAIGSRLLCPPHQWIWVCLQTTTLPPSLMLVSLVKGGSWSNARECIVKSLSHTHNHIHTHPIH